jgi:deoxycytidine triphosphate deaminase
MENGADKCKFRPNGEQCEQVFSCFKKIAGTLTKEEIILHKLVIPENDITLNYQPATVDLTLGNCHYVYDGDDSTSDTGKKWRLVFIGEAERFDYLNQNSNGAPKYSWQDDGRSKTLTIPRYGSALIELNETIDTRSAADSGHLIVGRFDLRLRLVQQGLVSQQGTQVEPYYRGKLYCFLHNFSNNSIEIKLGERVATAEFSYVSCFCSDEKRQEIIDSLGKKNSGKYNKNFCDGKGIREVRYFWDQDKLPDDCGLLGLKHDVRNDIFSSDTINSLAEKVEEKINLKLLISERNTNIKLLVVAAILAIIIPLISYGIDQLNDLMQEDSYVSTSMSQESTPSIPMPSTEAE